MSSSQQHISVFEVAEALRNTRDADTCLHGLNQLRRAVRGSDGPAFLQQYLSHAQAFDDLQSIWDAQLTAQNYHVTVTLLLALADVLNMAAQQQKLARHQPPQQQLLSAAAALAQGILSRRLKALYFNLSSEIRGKANAALTLLAALAGQGAETTRELARLFDFSLAALPALARLPRQRKSDAADTESGGAGLQARLWQQWRAGDVLKRPTRAAFVAFASALLQRADSITLSTLLATRPLMGGLLNHMAADPPEVQLQVLGLLRSRVLSQKAGIPPASQAEVLSDAVLLQLSQVASSAAVDSSSQEAAEGGDEQAQQAQQAADLAAGILEGVATDPSHGLCRAGAAAGVTLAAAVGAELTPGQKRLLRWLQRLRPSESAAHMDLIAACTAADPTLAVALLLSLPFSLDPSATGRWMAHTAVAGSLMHLVAGLPVGLSRLAERGGRPLGMDSRVVMGLLRCAVPPCLPKSALSRGVQHSSPLVRHTMLCLLARALDTVAALLADIAAGAAAAEPAAAPHWQELGRGVQSAVRAALPDPQPVLALFTALERGQQQQHKAPAAATAATKAAAAGAAGAAGAADEEEPELNLEGVQEEQPETDEDEEMVERPGNGEAGQEDQAAGQQAQQGLAGANEAMVSAVLRVLCGWQRALPAALAEAKVDAERLLPLDLLSLKPQHQYLFLELLLANLNSVAHGMTASTTQMASSGANATAPIALPSAALLLPVLRLLCGTRHAEVRQLAWRWLRERLVATGTFGSHPEEAQLWVSLLPRGAANPSFLPVCAFLSEALMQLQRRPHEFFELAQQQQQQQQSAGEGAAASSGGQACSLLALCVLRQALRLLPSPKMPSADKAAICAYVAAVLGSLLHQQQGGASAGAAACQMAQALLGVLRLEAQRGQQQQQPKEEDLGDGATGRKRRNGEALPADGQPLRLELPSEAQCLASLAQLLWQEAQRGAGALAGEAEGAHAKKKRRKSKGAELELGVEAQEQEAARAGRAVEVVCAAAGDSALPSLDIKLLKRLFESGEQQEQQQHAWDLQRRLACTPQASASAALTALAASTAAAAGSSNASVGSASGLAVEAEVIVTACLAHGLPLPPCSTTDEGHEGVQAWNALMDAAPVSLLLRTLMANHALSTSDGDGSGSRGAGAETDLLAAVQQQLSGGGSGSSGGGSSGLGGSESAAAVVRQCLHWLERATGAHQAQLMLQVAKGMLGQVAASAPSTEHWQCKPQPSCTEALSLIAQHPLVQSALAPAAAAAAGLGGQLGAVLAFGVVDLLRQQLQAAKGSELSSTLTAAAPLLHSVSHAFLQATQQPLALEAPAKKKKSQGGASTAGARAAAGVPPAAALWAMLLPWMSAADLRSAVGSLLHRLQQTGLAAPGDCLPGDRWVLDTAVSTIQELMGRGGPLDGDLLRSCCAALAWLLAGSPAGPADECVLTLLFGPHGLASLACLDQLASLQPGQLGEGTPASELLLQACLDDPSPTRSAIAVALVQHSTPARRRFASSLPALLKGVKGGQAGGLALLACVLPAAAAVMRLAAQQRPRAATAAGSGAEAIADAVRGDATNVAASVRLHLLSWASGKKHAGSDSLPTPGASEAAALLHAHALPCLQLCLELQPLSSDERERLVQRLLPPMGWNVEPAATGAGAAQGDSPGGLTVSERAQAAVLVLELMHSKAACQQPDAALLLCYLQTYTATLASLFKLAEPSPAQLELEALLLTQLDGALGDAVAALPFDQRVTKAFSQLADATCSFGTSVLRHRFASVAVMRTLRRFMAALLPDEQAGGGEGAGEEEVKPAAANGARRTSTGKAGSSSSDSDSDSEDGSSSKESSDSEGSSSSEDEGDSPTASGDGDSRRLARKATLAPAGPVHNPPVAAAALQLLQRIMTHSRFVASMRAAAASPPPLPAAAQALPRPLQSLLPLAELTASALAPRSAYSSSSPQGGGAQAGGDESMEAAALKRELCEHLETLLDLQDQYEEEGGAPAAAVQQAEAALLPLLMAGYGGSLSATDRAVWSLVQAINLRLWRRERPARMAANGRGRGGSSSSDSDDSGSSEDAGEEEREALAALLGGPLSDTGLAWGAAATALQAAGQAEVDDEARRSLLQAKLSLDPLRCALTAVHFPEWRTLSGQGAEAGEEAEAKAGAHAGSGCQASSSVQPAAPAAPPALPHASAGYDPAFLLPFTVLALRQRLLPARSVLQAGALSLCLRALAAADDSLRGLAYEAVALLQEQLEQEEFREKRQLSVLMGALRSAVTIPFQRLPAVHALFLAEAALVVMHPGAAMYPPVNKYLLKRAVLDLQDVPLFGQLMLGGAPQHAAERRWLLQLLAGGLRGAEDARLYRRRYVLELAMSLHDSSVADLQAALLALSVVCRATYVPRAARQLTAASGIIPWLTSAALSFLKSPAGQAAAGSVVESLAQQRGSATATTAQQEMQPVEEALAALLRLTRLRAVVRPGARDVIEDLEVAVQQLVGALGPMHGLGNGSVLLGRSCAVLQQLAGAVGELRQAGQQQQLAGAVGELRQAGQQQQHRSATG